MRSPRVRVGARRTSTHLKIPASTLAARVRIRRSTPDARRPTPDARRATRIVRRRRATLDVRRPTCDVRRSTCDARRSTCAEAPASSRVDARRAHGSAGASRPTRRPGGLVGARRRAGRPPKPGAAPTSTALVDRRRRIAVRPDARRASSCGAPRRAAKPRTEARLGAPMRSPRVRVGARRTSPHLKIPASTLAARVRIRRSTPDARRPTPDAHRASSTCDARRSTLDVRRSTLNLRRSTRKLPRRRPPRAWERRGVASDATARRLRRGATARGTPAEAGSRADFDRPRRSPTSDRRTPRRAPRVVVRRAPTCRQAAHGGAPWRSHAFTARPRRSASHVDAPEDSRVDPRRRSTCDARRSTFDLRRSTRKLPRRRPPRAWERRAVASDATARRPRRGAAARGTPAEAGSRADFDRPRRSPTSDRRTPRRAPRAVGARAPRPPTRTDVGVRARRDGGGPDATRRTGRSLPRPPRPLTPARAATPRAFRRCGRGSSACPACGRGRGRASRRGRGGSP
jgi:hypothetical protein